MRTLETTILHLRAVEVLNPSQEKKLMVPKITCVDGLAITLMYTFGFVIKKKSVPLKKKKRKKVEAQHLF